MTAGAYYFFLLDWYLRKGIDDGISENDFLDKISKLLCESN